MILVEPIAACLLNPVEFRSSLELSYLKNHLHFSNVDFSGQSERFEVSD